MDISMESENLSKLDTKELEAFVVNLTECINSFYEVVNTILITTVNPFGEVNGIEVNIN